MRWGNEVLPENLKHKAHWDWIFPLSLIPRAWTSIDIGRPKMILGNQKDIRDFAPAAIGEQRSFQVSYYPDAPWWLKPFTLYAAVSLKAKDDGMYRHFRIGCRYDSEGYSTLFSVASRKYPIIGERDTSTN